MKTAAYFLRLFVVFNGGRRSSSRSSLCTTASPGCHDWGETTRQAFYTVASGLAKVVTEAAPFEMAVQPYSGSTTFLPLLNAGEVNLGVVNGVESDGK